MALLRRSRVRFPRRAIAHPGIAVCFEFLRKCRITTFDDAAVGQHVHEVGPDVTQHPLLTRAHEGTPFGRAQAAHAFGNLLQRVDVEPGVGFVEDREAWLQHRHLEHLVALLLAA